MRKSGLGVLIVAAALVAMPASGGSIYLTGHDVLLHNGQNGYWQVILDFLRGAGTGDEIAEADYDLVFLHTGSSWDFASNGYAGSVTEYNPNSMSAGDWLDAFSKDVIVVPWTGSGDFDAGARTAFNAQKAALEAFINAGGDLWMNSSNGATDYYTVLPAAAFSDGPTISGSSGFTATTEGVAIGILPNMINGFPTHNSFDTVASVMTVFEVRETAPISIGVFDATIVDDDIVVPSTPPMFLMLLAILLVLGTLWVLRARSVRGV